MWFYHLNAIYNVIVIFKPMICLIVFNKYYFIMYLYKSSWGDWAWISSAGRHYAPWWELFFLGFWSRSFILVREMRIQCIFEEKIDSLWNIWKRCSRLETQFHIEWKSKTKNGNFLHYEQVRAGQLEDM